MGVFYAIGKFITLKSGKVFLRLFNNEQQIGVIMKKGQTYTGIVERVVFPNKGIIKLEDEKTVIVKNVIPGQKISFIVNKVRKGRGEGRLLEIEYVMG